MSDDKQIIGSFYLDDGSQVELTNNDFIELLETGISGEDNDKTKMLLSVLDSILDFAAKQPDISDNAAIAETLEGMREIVNFLRGNKSEDEIRKFLKGKREFMVVPLPAGMEDYLSISSITNKRVIKQFDDIKVTFDGRLGIEEQKIHTLFRMAFADMNYHGSTKNLNTKVFIPFTDTMEKLGRKVNSRNKTAFAKKLNEVILPSIANQYIELQNKEGSFRRIQIGGGDAGANVREDYIFMKFSDPYALYLNTGSMSQYSNKTISLGTQKNPLPYYLAKKLQHQYFRYGNISRGTNVILSIKKIMEFCSDTIPSYEYVQQTDRGHWVRQIRQPLEAALNDIRNIGLFEWEYCNKGMAEASQDQIESSNFEVWSKLYITFKLIPDDPGTEERMKRRSERIEAAKAKKALKDAEIIVKADQIQQKKRSKKKKKS